MTSALATSHMLRTIQTPGATRDTVAEVMAAELNNEVDWPRVNRAIMTHWSYAGLLYIKRQAWKRAAS